MRSGQVSNAATVYIGVTPVNDAPAFAKGADQAVLEDAAVQTVANWATAISAGPNELSQTVDFIVSNNNPALFATQPSVRAERDADVQADRQRQRQRAPSAVQAA